MPAWADTRGIADVGDYWLDGVRVRAPAGSGHMSSTERSFPPQR